MIFTTKDVLENVQNMAHILGMSENSILAFSLALGAMALAEIVAPLSTVAREAHREVRRGVVEALIDRD